MRTLENELRFFNVNQVSTGDIPPRLGSRLIGEQLLWEGTQRSGAAFSLCRMHLPYHQSSPLASTALLNL